MTYRVCEDCGVGEANEMLALSGTALVCQGCESQRENDWVAEDPDNRKHSLDTFSPYGD